VFYCQTLHDFADFLVDHTAVSVKAHADTLIHYIFYILRSFYYRSIYSVNGMIINEKLTGEDLEGRVRGLRHLLGGTEENHDEPQPGWPVYRPRFEPTPTEYKS
jgi:hypothetical protein